MIGLGKPEPKLNDKVGSSFTRTKQRTPRAVWNICEGALKETPRVYLGPNDESREDLDFMFGREKVASARRIYEGLSTVVTSPPRLATHTYCEKCKS